MGKVPSLKEEFARKRRLILKRSQAGEMNERQCLDYINTVLKYDQEIITELDHNLEELCDKLDITKDDIRQSQNRYLDSKNSHKLLGTEEVLNAKIP